MKKSKYSVALFVNGLLSLISSCAAMMYQAMTPVSGAQKMIDPVYADVVSKMEASVDSLKLLVPVGVVLLMISIVFKKVNHTETKKGAIIAFWVPLVILVLYSIINYIPVLNFHTMYR